MIKRIVIREVDYKDSLSIHNLIKSGLSLNQLDMTIYSCDGYKKYLQFILGGKRSFLVNRFYGIYQNDILLGFIEWRKYNNFVILNNIFISKEYKGKELGKKLFNTWKVLYKERSFDFIYLDVFKSNSVALNWYKKIGFQIEYEKIWAEFKYDLLDNNDIIAKDKIIINNYPQTEVILSNFEFANYSIMTSLDEYKIGVLKNRYFVIYSIKSLFDKELMYALAGVNKKNKILVCFNSNKEPDYSVQNEKMIIRERSYRMCYRVKKKASKWN